MAPAVTSAARGPGPPRVPVPVHRGRGRGGLGGHEELPAGQMLGQPDLVDVDAPGHHHHGRGEARRPQSEQPGDHGMTGISQHSGEHVISPSLNVSAASREYSNIESNPLKALDGFPWLAGALAAARGFVTGLS